MQWPVKDDQLARAGEFRDKWLKFILSSRESSYLESPSEITNDVQWLYKESHLSVPQQVVVANGPKEYSDSVSRNRGHSERRSGRTVQVAALDTGVNSSLESGLWGRIYHKYDEAVRRLIYPAHVTTVTRTIRDGMNRPLTVFFNSVFNRRVNVWSMETMKQGLLSDGPWLAEADFYDEVCGIPESDELRRYASFLKRGVFEISAFSHTAVALNAPKEIHLNEDYRPHSMSGPAIVWRDGNRSYYLHGVAFAEDLWKKVKERSITAEAVVGLGNIEQRTIALRMIGYENVLKELGAKVLAQKDVVAKPSGRKIHYEVLEADLHDDSPWMKSRFVKVQCPSTGKETLIRVDPRSETSTVEGAVAWTFGLRPEQYNPELET